MPRYLGVEGYITIEGTGVEANRYQFIKAQMLRAAALTIAGEVNADWLAERMGYSPAKMSVAVSFLSEIVREMLNDAHHWDRTTVFPQSKT